MKERNKTFFLLLLLLFLFVYRGEAQIEKMRNYVFSNDSLGGFDEPAASAGALANNCFGGEYKVFMYRAKRTYIKQKYHLRDVPVVPMTLFKLPLSGARTMTMGPACDNEDFEAASSQINAPGTVQGWTVQSGSNSNSCLPPTLNGNNNYTVFTSPTIDGITGISVSSYFDASINSTPAGNCFIRLNDASAGAKASSLTKSFLVTTSNSLFEYAYLPVIEAGPHDCCDQPGFNMHITITNTATGASTVLACPQISVAIPGPLCQYTPGPDDPVFVTAANNTGWLYHNWSASAIDLTQYIGDQITFNIVVVDCDQGGHGAYAYFDARCAPMTIMGNNNSFPAGTPSITLPTCGMASATICAPPGMGPYTWQGGALVAPYTTPLVTNQCFTTGISSQYTLTMTPPGACNPIIRVVTVTITPSPYILASIVQPTCGSPFATISFTAAGSASVHPTVTWSPAPTSTTSSAQNLGTATYPVGTGVVTVTAQDPLGCQVSATVDIKSPPPNPTVGIVNVTGSSSITCVTPSVVLLGVSGYTYGTLDYFWSANSFTSNSQSFTVSIVSSVITLIATDPATGCSASATTAVQVNTIAPTFSVTPFSQNVNCAPGAAPVTVTATAMSPTTNVTHVWISPCAPTNSIMSGGQVSIFQPCLMGSNGTNTIIIINDVTGCTTMKTVTVNSTAGAFPTFNLAGTYSVGCSTTSLTSVTVNNGQGAGGGQVTYTMLPPNYSGGPGYGTSPSAITYTINSPGTYTFIVKDATSLCETRIPISIVQNTFGPNVQALAPTYTLDCFTPSVQLVAFSTATTSLAYAWTFQNGGNPNTNTNPTITVATGTAPATSTIVNTYTLQITDQNNACVSTSIVPIYQNINPPTASIAVQSNIVTCKTPMVILNNASKSNVLPPFTKFKPQVGKWWFGPTPQLPDSSRSTYDAYTPGIYTMTTVDMNNGCIGTATTQILDGRVYPIINADTLVPLDCDAATSGGVKLAATVQGLSAGQVTAQWTFPQPPPNIQNPQTLTLTTDGVGEYKLTVTTSSNGCSHEVFVEVTPGMLTGGFTPDKENGYAPLTVNFTNNSSSTSSVSGTSSITSVWSFGNGTTKTTTTNVSTSAVYTAPGTYTVTMFASKGSCRDTIVKVITVDIPSKLVVPNVFTPNGDGDNDIFFLQAANLTDINCQVFDRWGNKIYDIDSNTGNIAWDGKNQSGHEAPDGTYFYTIKAAGKDGQNYNTKGTVSLYR